MICNENYNMTVCLFFFEKRLEHMQKSLTLVEKNNIIIVVTKKM